MRITGFTYLTIENILNFALNPITIIFLLFIIIFLTMVTIFDISTLIIIFDSSYKNKKISVMDSIKISQVPRKQDGLISVQIQMTEDRSGVLV